MGSQLDLLSTLEPLSPQALTQNDEQVQLADGPALESTWSASVALDPKHRPQTYDRPSSTVRREWCRSPQEAHLLDVENSRYRRLTVHETAVLQGFPPDWFDVEDLTRWQRVEAIGDAVPPPLAAAVVAGITEVAEPKLMTALEVCAGSGGLAFGASASGYRHLALVERWESACQILARHPEHWAEDAIVEGDVREFDFAAFRDEVGLLSGGPPCQPWSQAGLSQGHSDHRDLLGEIDEVVATVRPEAFVFENVPGLISTANRPYFADLIRRLRKPDDDLEYGVIAGVLNSADFGVPQTRRRVFIVGVRGRPNADAYRALDAARAQATHRSPHVADDERDSWRTVGDAIGSMPDPGGWRSWSFKGA